MTDKERREDEALKKCIQDAYGCSDEQLAKELEELENSLSESDFPGIESRLMSKVMKRIADEVEFDPEMSEELDDDLELDEDEITEPESGPALEVVESSMDETKVVRIGKKKVLLVAALAAAFVGVLGVTAIGGKNYFFREDEKEKGIVFDSGKNISDASNLESAYKEIELEIGNRIFALNYLPQGTKFIELIFDGDKANIKLEYNGNYLYFVQYKRDVEVSLNMDSDREKGGQVKNQWLNMEIDYDENQLDSGNIEFEAKVEVDGVVAWVFGKMEREEFEKIIENIFIY